MLETPVVLIVFNRPDATEMVLKQIAKIKPRQLFVIADGPRLGHPEDEGKCAATRALIDGVDWDCKVYKNFSDTNMGCGHRPHTGISWVFSHVDRAIILEDDCIPEITFFRFCEESLKKYENDSRVMHISGVCPLYCPPYYSYPKLPYSYYFTRSLTCWGWATWRRAWQYYDFEMPLWPELRDTDWLMDILGHRRIAKFMHYIFTKHCTEGDKSSSWDQKWNLAVWAQYGLGIRPNVNLITNVGFGDDATHKFWCKKKEYFDFPVSEMEFPLRHPSYVLRDFSADRFAFDIFFASRPLSLSKRRKIVRGILNGLSRMNLLKKLLPKKTRSSIAKVLTG